MWSFYITDGMQTLAVIENDTLRYMNLVGGDLFGRIEASSGTISTGNTRRYYLKDHLGSTRVVVGNDGIVKETHDFYPFGLTMPGRSKGEALTREQFTGQLRDNEAGFNLDYFGARYYDPAVPRFISVDPLADQYPGWSPYVYALNNPLRYNDPTGMCPADPENDIECIEGGELGEVVVTAQRPGSGSSFSFATFALGATRVGGHALVRTPNPYAVTAGGILLGGALIADLFIETPAERMMQAQSESGKDAVFPDESDLARRLGVPRSKLHDKVKEVTDSFPEEKRKIGARNPDIGISSDGTIVLKNRNTGRTIDTEIPLDTFKD